MFRQIHITMCNWLINSTNGSPLAISKPPEAVNHMLINWPWDWDMGIWLSYAKLKWFWIQRSLVLNPKLKPLGLQVCYKWPCSIAMWNYQRVGWLPNRDFCCLKLFAISTSNARGKPTAQEHLIAYAKTAWNIATHQIPAVEWLGSRGAFPVPSLNGLKWASIFYGVYQNMSGSR